MDITPTISKDRLLIDRYGNGGFVVRGESHSGNLLLGSEATTWDGSLSVQSLAPLFVVAPEVLIIGLGKSFAPLDPKLREVLRSKGIMAEAMDTGAACRTYNVLLSEDRKVAVALIAI